MKNLMLGFCFLVSFGLCHTSQSGQVPKNWPANVKYQLGDTQYNGLDGDLGMHVEIRYISEKIGCGLFALHDIENDVVLGEYTGEKTIVYSSLLKWYPYAVSIANFNPETKKYNYDAIMNLKGGYMQLIINAQTVGNETRFCNHSDKPNANLVRANNHDISQDHVWLVTTDGIKAGEEITITYGSDYWKARGIVPVSR